MAARLGGERHVGSFAVKPLSDKPAQKGHIILYVRAERECRPTRPGEKLDLSTDGTADPNGEIENVLGRVIAEGEVVTREVDLEKQVVAEGGRVAIAGCHVLKAVPEVEVEPQRLASPHEAPRDDLAVFRGALDSIEATSDEILETWDLFMW